MNRLVWFLFLHFFSLPTCRVCKSQKALPVPICCKVSTLALLCLVFSRLFETIIELKGSTLAFHMPPQYNVLNCLHTYSSSSQFSFALSFPWANIIYPTQPLSFHVWLKLCFHGPCLAHIQEAATNTYIILLMWCTPGRLSSKMPLWMSWRVPLAKFLPCRLDSCCYSCICLFLPAQYVS